MWKFIFYKARENVSLTCYVLRSTTLYMSQVSSPGDIDPKRAENKT
jgi:hypothetical protein